MKRYITNRILIFALILTLLCGCAAPDLPTDPTDEPLVSTNPSTEPSEPTTESTSDPTTEPTSEPTDTNPNAGNLLFEPQIEILERTFSYSSEFPLPINWYTMGLFREFSTPEEVDVYSIFRFGTRTSEEEWNLTQEEVSYLSQFSAFNGVAEGRLRVYRIPIEKVYEVMKQYFGLEPDEIPIVDYLRMVYWEETCCYYVANHGFLGDIEVEILYAERLDDGKIRFVYTNPNQIAPYFGGEAVVESFVGGFRFVSNQHHDAPPEGY